MIKLRLYKFLGNFIPYFKRKMMNEDTLLRKVKNEIDNHFRTYSDNGAFSFELSIRNPNNHENQIISFNVRITYRKTIDIFVSIEYSNDSIIFRQSRFPDCELEMFSILSDYLNHFSSIKNDDIIYYCQVFLDYNNIKRKKLKSF